MLILTVLAASLLTCFSQPDSAGTKFIFGYIRDADRDVSNQLLSVTVLNANSFDCLISIQYREDYEAPLITKNFNVPKTNMTEVPIPSWYGWLYDSGGMQDDKGPRQLISANSSCPVTLIANNHDNATLQDDSYLVLPTKWANNVYAFTLPPASDGKQNHHITIIPTESDVKGALTAGSDTFAFTAKVNGPTVYYMSTTQKSQSMTYRIESDIGGPILILAGVTCAGMYTACDHAAFMPQPMLRPLCLSGSSYAEDHPASISNITGFYANIPQFCYSQNMTVSNRGPASKQYLLSDSPQTPLLSFDSSFGTAVNMHVDRAPINIVRYHDMSGMGKQGAFIDNVASTNQFFTGNSSFFTKNDRDTIEVVCMVTVCLTMTLDGNKITSYNPTMTTIGEIEGVNYYAFVVTVPAKGFHMIYSTVDDPYVYYVIGRSEHSMYGFIGGVNMPVYPNVTSPATTASQPTTKSSTPAVKSSTSTSSSKSPSSTTISSSSSTPSTTKLTTKAASTASSPTSQPPPTAASTRYSSSSSTPSTTKLTTQPTSKPVTSPSSTKSTTNLPSTPSTTKLTTKIASTASAPTSQPPPSTASTGISSSSSTPSNLSTSQSSSSTTSIASSSPGTPSKATSPSTSTVTSAPSSSPSTSTTTVTSAPSSSPSTSTTTVTSAPSFNPSTSTTMPVSTSAASSNTPKPTSTLPNRLTTSTKAQTLSQSSSTKITTRSSAPPILTSTTLPVTTSSSYSFSSFFLATILATCLWFSL